MKKYGAIALGLAIITAAFAACSSNGNDNVKISFTTSNQEAVSTAVAGTCATTSTGSAVSGAGNASSADVELPGSIREGIVNYVARRATDSIKSSYSNDENEKTVSQTISGDTVTIDFTNEVLTNTAGGTATLNGPLVFTMTNGPGQSQRTLTVNGSISVSLSDYASSETIENATYSEIINGTWTLDFTGKFIASFDNSNNLIAMVSDLLATVTGSNIEVTGTATGTASVTLTITLTGDAVSSDGFATECNGRVAGVTNEGSFSCAISSDCNTCE